MSTQETGSDTGHDGQADGIHTAPETGGTVGAQAESWRLNIAEGSIFDQDRALVCVLPASCVTSEWERRARLIAAAPTLLGACEDALAGISDWRLGSETADHGDMRNLRAADAYLSSVLATLRAAIAKASGR